jgi:hypothetical protein
MGRVSVAASGVTSGGEPVRSKVLQISVPRGGSNAVARMMGQSPDIAAVLRSRLLEDGWSGLQQALRAVEREAPDGLPYVKEHAAFLPERPDDLFARHDRFLVVVRDPAQQLASAVLAIAGNTELLRDKLVERGRDVERREIVRFLDRYAGAAAADLPSGESGAGASWADLVGYVRRTYDFRPLHRLFADLFAEQPERERCRSDMEWFNRAIFRVAARSWTRAVEAVGRIDAIGARRLAIVDFTALQDRPELVAQVCDRLAVRYDERMVTGPWRPPGRWFDAGLDRHEGHRWAGRARASRRLHRSRAVPYDPRALPAAARDAFGESLESYRALLAHPAYLGPGDAPGSGNAGVAARGARRGDGG